MVVVIRVIAVGMVVPVTIRISARGCVSRVSGPVVVVGRAIAVGVVVTPIAEKR